ncbi:MAG: manganese catalase family protein [Nitrospinota bacterium]|nr:manganese catalase family protein [Nitrospinota bacterium]
MSSKEIRDIERKIEALVIAIPREVEAHEYYMELYEQYTDPVSKEMFLFLAKQEKSHQEQLERLLNSLEEQLAELQKK